MGFTAPFTASRSGTIVILPVTYQEYYFYMQVWEIAGCRGSSVLGRRWGPCARGKVAPCVLDQVADSPEPLSVS